VIGPGGFSQRLSALGPFEPRPHLAVAVSGGSDSLALALLAHDWVGAQGGALTALTVDHGLRPEARAEALRVGRWLKKRGIRHQILTWTGEKPKQGLMAAARQARYRLLEDWCQKAGVLHLLLAHQIEDQAETFLMRLARGSGVNGLACMAPVLHTRHVRLLRPLLAVGRDDLKSYLKAQGQAWIDDPSNENPLFERVRLRAGAGALKELGLTASALAASAAKLAGTRHFLELEAARLLACHVRLEQAGFAWMNPAWLEEEAENGKIGMAQLLTCLGGEVFPPQDEALGKLMEAMKRPDWRGATLAGCRLAMRQGRILIGREAAACQGPIRLIPGQSGLWDGRFRYACERGRGLILRALGSQGAQALARFKPVLAALPPMVWASLPAIYDARGVFAVPALGYKRSRRSQEPLSELVFAPRRTMTGSNLLLS
jgi:tRNA(Ile)-lysidine synthase